MNCVYGNNEITLLISDEVLSKFLNYIETYDYRIESGGIIVGQLNPAENQVIMTDITEPCIKDKCSAFSFKRSEFGHQEIMDELWESSNQTKTYLGEWHTHNQGIPQPSYIDIKNWIHITKKQQNLNWIFFVIIGTKKIGIWTVRNNVVVQLIENINH